MPDRIRKISWYSEKTYLPLILTAFFFLFGLFNIQYHEMWPDETEPWLLARDSNSIAELFFYKRYEGHPNIWYLLLYVVTAFTHNPVTMQYLHVGIAACMVFVFVKYAPFPWYIRLLFPFGYFTLYEFSVVSRLYSLGILFLFCACAFLVKPQRNWLAIAFFLALAFNSNLFSFLIAGVMMVYVEVLFFRQKLKIHSKIHFGLAVLLLTGGILFALYGMHRPPGASVEVGYEWKRYFLNVALSSGWNSFFPFITQLDPVGTSNIIHSLTIRAFAAIFLFVVLALCLSRKPFALGAYTVISGFLFLIFLSAYDWSMRHQAHFYFGYLVIWWLAENLETKQKGIGVSWYKLNWLSEFFYQNRYKILAICMLGSAAGAVVALYQEYKFPYYPAKETAAYIRQFNTDSVQVVATSDFHTSTIAAYNNSKIYYLNSGLGSFFTLQKQQERTQNVYGAKELPELSRTLKKDLLIIDHWALSEEIIRKFKLKKVFETKKSLAGRTLKVYLFSWRSGLM